jgi:signal transduction histidine kinase
VDPLKLLGKNFVRLFPQGRNAIARARKGGEANFTLRGHGSDADWHAEFSILAEEGSEPGCLTFLGRDVTEIRWLERRILTISDAERERIGADLHDGLGQQLTGLSCLAAAMRERLKKSNPKEGKKAASIARIANEASVQARALARGHCPVQLEQGGLVSALEELARQSQLLLGITCEFRTRGAAPRCDHWSAIHLYRITQESINNAVRHGGARHLRIGLVSHRSRHRLIIADDGRGFDSTVERRVPGGGLRLMNYRATAIGAEFRVTSRPGKGARVTCSFASTSHEKDFRNQGENASDPAETPDPAGR